MYYQTILERLIKKDVFCQVVDGDNTQYYISDFLASILENHSDADIIYPVNTPPIWARFSDDEELQDDPELQEAACTLAYIQAELWRLEHTDKQDKQEAII